MTICLSHSGVSVYSADTPSNELLVATVDGITVLKREGGRESWSVADRWLSGYHVCSLTIDPETGIMIAGTHNGGVALSKDQGRTWTFSNDGLKSENVFSVATATVGGRTLFYAGTEPAHLHVSEDLGATWSDRPKLQSVPNRGDWTFPPPPHEAHVKHISFDPDNAECVYVCVEQGELLRSLDGGETWQDLLGPAGVVQEAEGDAHRLIVRPSRPNEMFLPTGFGLFFSEDKGLTWRNIKAQLPWIGYPDPMVYDPARQDVLFVAGAKDDPGNWIGRKDANASVARSRDGGRTWERVNSDLPEGMTASIEAMALESSGGRCTVFLGTTNGDVFSSVDDGDSWTLIASGLPSISKGLHFLLAKGMLPGPPGGAPGGPPEGGRPQGGPPRGANISA